MNIRKQTVYLGIVWLLGVSACAAPGGTTGDRGAGAAPQRLDFPDPLLRVNDSMGWPAQEAFPSQLLLPLMYTDQVGIYDTLLLN